VLFGSWACWRAAVWAPFLSLKARRNSGARAAFENGDGTWAKGAAEHGSISNGGGRMALNPLALPCRGLNGAVISSERGRAFCVDAA